MLALLGSGGGITLGHGHTRLWDQHLSGGMQAILKMPPLFVETTVCNINELEE